MVEPSTPSNASSTSLSSSVSSSQSPSLDGPHPRRIALVIHALVGGGAERLMSQLANRWSQAGWDVHLVTLASVADSNAQLSNSTSTTANDTNAGKTEEYSVAHEIHRHGLDLMRPSRNWFDAFRANWVRVRRLRSVLTELSPDCIISFCDRMNITTITAALSLGKPLWIAEHSDPKRQHLGLLWEIWRQLAYRRLARAPRTGCVVLSDTIAQSMRERFPGLTLKVIPPAIHLHDCTNTKTQESASDFQGPTEGSYQLLSMGRHSPEKNLAALLRAWQQLRTQFPEWRLVLAGDGPQHAELKALAQQLQSGASVQFAGWVSDPWSLYRQSSLLAITSHYEGVPVALLEAMAAGVACVSTPCASTVVQFSQAGAVQLAPSTGWEDIASALSVAMGDAQLRQRLAERGRQLAQQFSWESVGPRWDELLNKLV